MLGLVTHANHADHPDHHAIEKGVSAKQVVERALTDHPIIASFIDTTTFIHSANRDPEGVYAGLLSDIQTLQALRHDPSVGGRLSPFFRRNAVDRQVRAANQEGFRAMVSILTDLAQRVQPVVPVNRGIMGSWAPTDDRRQQLENAALNQLSPNAPGTVDRFVEVVLVRHMPVLLVDGFNHQLIATLESSGRGFRGLRTQQQTHSLRPLEARERLAVAVDAAPQAELITLLFQAIVRRYQQFARLIDSEDSDELTTAAHLRIEVVLNQFPALLGL